MAQLRQSLADTLGNASLAKGNALGQAYQLGNTTYDKVITGQTKSSQSSGGGLSGIGSILGAAASFAKMSSKTYKTKGKKVKFDLDQLDQLPVERWKYKKSTNIDPSGQEHIGPYAEDFHKIFKVGDGKSIPLISEAGILWGLIKELNKKIDKNIKGDK